MKNKFGCCPWNRVLDVGNYNKKKMKKVKSEKNTEKSQKNVKNQIKSRNMSDIWTGHKTL